MTKLIAGGQEIEFCTIGELARMLNRKPGTIRAWEAAGVIPSSGYVTASQDPHGRRRVYTRAQADGIARIAQEEGILVPGPLVHVSDTEFTTRVLGLFASLQRPSGTRKRSRTD